MARKIKFPLEIDGTEVRSLEELRENFSVLRVLEYLKNGKLEVWLRDRGLNDMADQTQKLDAEDPDCMKKLCEILGFAQEEISRFDKIFRLKKYSAEEKYEKVLDQIAFDQGGLQELLEKGINKIYLCGDEFSIPLSRSGIKYIGINNPVAIIDSKEKIDWIEKEISIENMTFDEQYQNISGQIGPETCNQIDPGYQPSLKFKGYLGNSAIDQCKKNYDLLRKEFLTIHFAKNVSSFWDIFQKFFG